MKADENYVIGQSDVAGPVPENWESIARDNSRALEAMMDAIKNGEDVKLVVAPYP